jgi:hypothetical protein
MTNTQHTRDFAKRRSGRRFISKTYSNVVFLYLTSEDATRGQRAENCRRWRCWADATSSDSQNSFHCVDEAEKKLFVSLYELWEATQSNKSFSSTSRREPLDKISRILATSLICVLNLQRSSWKSDCGSWRRYWRRSCRGENFKFKLWRECKKLIESFGEKNLNLWKTI